MTDLANKKERLRRLLAKYLDNGLILALSGGVDSALLLGVIAGFPENQKQKFLAITFETILYPEDEMATAKQLCLEFNLCHRLIRPVVEIPDEIANNPKDRCYLCKKNLFCQVVEMAKQEGYHYIIDGTNADDQKSYRPGKKALEELGIASPLADCGFRKAEIREYAGQLGLAVAEKPSGSCYATRFPYGAQLEVKMIAKLAELEEFFRSFGIGQIRVRFHQPILRVELMPEEFSIFLQHREKALQKATELGFMYLTLDVAGFRSGSMDIDLLAPNVYL